MCIVILHDVVFMSRVHVGLHVTVHGSHDIWYMNMRSHLAFHSYHTLCYKQAPSWYEMKWTVKPKMFRFVSVSFREF